jgi:hypothetical protein
LRQGYTAVEQSRAVFILRRDIRKAHVDVRFNSRVAADCWSLIDAIENGEIYIKSPPSSAMATPRKTTTVNRKRRSLNSQSIPSQAVATQRKSKRNKT